jgi:hypothetical protein
MLCEGTECRMLCLELCSDGCATAVQLLHAEYKQVKQKWHYCVFTSISSHCGFDTF